MLALIVNSGIGSRMGEETKTHPKCMTKISEKETIVSRQLKLLAKLHIHQVVMTTGYLDNMLMDYCKSLHLPIEITFVNNPIYDKTNYIYSVYCARELLKNEDILLIHGDLVFTEKVLESIMRSELSSVTVSSTSSIPQKDFKAVIKEEKIAKIGVDFFENVLAVQPLYKIQKEDWKKWLEKIKEFCENDKTNCYAEDAFNEISDKCQMYPLDIKEELCAEIDNLEDLQNVKEKLKKLGE